MTRDFAFTINSIRFDEDYKPSDSTRITVNRVQPRPHTKGTQGTERMGEAALKGVNIGRES